MHWHFVRVDPVFAASTELSGCRGPGMPHFWVDPFLHEDQPYFIWFVLSGTRKEGTVGPWWLIERSVS